MASNENENTSTNTNNDSNTRNKPAPSISSEEIVRITTELGGNSEGEKIGKSLKNNLVTVKLFDTLAKAYKEDELVKLGLKCDLDSGVATGLALDLIDKYPKAQSNQSDTNTIEKIQKLEDTIIDLQKQLQAEEKKCWKWWKWCEKWINSEWFIPIAVLLWEILFFFIGWWAGGGTTDAAIGSAVGTTQGTIPVIINWSHTQQAIKYAKAIAKKDESIMSDIQQ